MIVKLLKSIKYSILRIVALYQVFGLTVIFSDGHSRMDDISKSLHEMSEACFDAQMKLDEYVHYLKDVYKKEICAFQVPKKYLGCGE
jgi:hypothetical protein